MGKAYSMDLRSRVVKGHEEGQKAAELANRFQVSERWIYQLLERRRETGSIEPKRGKPGPQPKLSEHLDHLVELVRKRPDATLEELKEELPVSVCITTISKALRGLGLTFKKSHLRSRAATA